MKDYYDHLYLSPHFDDVALSCGGAVFRHTAAGDSVLVVTIAAADPPDQLQSEAVQFLHHRWAEGLSGEAAEAVVGQRRAEDREAFAVLNADVLHLPILDCIYRCSPDSGELLYPGSTDMFGPSHPADTDVNDTLVGALAALPPAGRVYLPLGVGNHVDHIVARQVGETVFGDVVFYEDYPYTMKLDALEATLPISARGGWAAETIWLTEAALAAKIAAISAYRSQLSSFFTSPDDLAEKLRADGLRVMADARDDGEQAPDWAIGGERLWQRAHLSR